jgi:predicted lipoprotein with Yx(FWY)xxD motif
MSFVHPRRMALAVLLAAAGTMVAVAAAQPRQAGKRGAVVNVSSTLIGELLVDAQGHTLYVYSPDRKNTSTCYGQCASFWPPLLTKARPVAGAGAKASLLGTTKRKDGTLQVTYAGHPLYRFAKDVDAGDLNGQDFEDVWHVIGPAGKRITDAVPAPVLAVADSSLGKIVTDAKGMTLYLFKKDVGTTSNCYAQCAANWPPLILDPSARLIAGKGLESSLLGTTQRTDGSMQVTYNGHPLYHYSKDTKPGDTVGQGVGTIWFVVSPSGQQVGP